MLKEKKEKSLMQRTTIDWLHHIMCTTIYEKLSIDQTSFVLKVYMLTDHCLKAPISLIDNISLPLKKM